MPFGDHRMQSTMSSPIYSTIPETERGTVIRTSWGFFANSILAALLGVVFARLVEQFGVAVAGAILDRDPVFTHVVTTLGASGSDLVFAGGTAASLLVGVGLLLVFPGAEDRSIGKLAALWTILFCFRNAFADLIRIPLDAESPAALALAELSLPAGLDIVLAITGALGLLLVGLAAAPAFLGFSRHRSEVATKQERLRFMGSIALIPAITAPLMATIFFVPDNGSGYISQLPLLGLFVLISMVAAPWTTEIRAPQLVAERGVSWGLVAVVVVVLVAQRVLLEPGVPIPPWNEDLSWHLRP